MSILAVKELSKTYGRIQAFDFASASAVATVMLVISFAVLLGLDLLQRRAQRHGW